MPVNWEVRGKILTGRCTIWQTRKAGRPRKLEAPDMMPLRCRPVICSKVLSSETRVSVRAAGLEAEMSSDEQQQWGRTTVLLNMCRLKNLHVPNDDKFCEGCSLMAAYAVLVGMAHDDDDDASNNDAAVSWHFRKDHESHIKPLLI